MGIYKPAAVSLIDACRDYRAGKLTLSELKARVWEVARSIVAVEEKTLREFLQQAEGRLDMVEHTTDAAKAFDASLVIVTDVEQQLESYLADDDAGHRGSS